MMRRIGSESEEAFQVQNDERRSKETGTETAIAALWRYYNGDEKV